MNLVQRSFCHRAARGLALTAGLALLAAALLAPLPGPRATRSVIVQGKELASVKAAIRAAGGGITRELGVIHAVAAELTDAQEEAL